MAETSAKILRTQAVQYKGLDYHYHCPHCNQFQGAIFNPKEPELKTCRKCEKKFWLDPGEAIAHKPQWVRIEFDGEYFVRCPKCGMKNSTENKSSKKIVCSKCSKEITTMRPQDNW